MSGVSKVLSSIRARLPSLFRRKTKAGTDELGNTYYRWTEGQLDGGERERREVDLGGKEFDPDLIPPEWSQWLRKTREDPPTAEDVEKGKAFRRQVQARAVVHAAEDLRRAARARSEGDSGPEPNAGAFVQQITDMQRDPSKQ